MKIDLYSQSGEKTGTLDLPKEIFEIPFNEDLVHQALLRQLSNRRAATAFTKTKGEVSGRNMKPYRQKGTGYARQGSLRNPHFRGGGVAFGPRAVENYVTDMPKKQRRKALFCALSEKARQNDILGLESFEAKTPKTKDFAAMLKKLPIERDVLVVLPEKDNILAKASRNIPSTKTILVNYLNIQDLQKFDKVLLLKGAVEKMKEVFLK